MTNIKYLATPYITNNKISKYNIMLAYVQKQEGAVALYTMLKLTWQELNS